ncbi:zinc finger protein [Rutstroemia sp. NJR-2017a WRK4]|nr:zinc finger protein [Rutstroemia sp. NJR-2017a WRK4]
MDKQLESRNKGTNYVQAYPAAITQDTTTTPWPKEVAECSAHPDAHRENRAERHPVEGKSAGSRRPWMRLCRRAANSGSHPTKVSDIKRRTEKGIWDGRTGHIDLRAILNEPKLVTKAIRFMEQTRLLGQFQSCDAEQRDEVERWGETEGTGTRDG